MEVHKLVISSVIRGEVMRKAVTERTKKPFISIFDGRSLINVFVNDIEKYQEREIVEIPVNIITDKCFVREVN